MDRRRTAGLLLALAACFATANAAPTASNHTALDLYHGAPDGCYYNFQHYGEGDRIMTNEPCLNCTCHNRMLMCYLRVCPFTKPIGQDCTIEKRADQCCPIVTCPDVPVDLLTSTTTSPAEYGPTGIGKLDKFGCSINGKYFSEGSKVPPTPNKPCEHCYCIRNMTTCVMQECTLHVDGCTPIYHKDVCCPVRYSCDHPEDEMPLLDDLSTTVRPTPGFLLTTTTISPVTQMSQDCVYDNRIFPDGALIKTEKACDHCYCMKGDIVCVVQECGTPMENEGKNCTALTPREGVCCPDTYICEGDESSTGTYDADEFTTHAGQEKLTTWSPPRRTSSEGSGYRNEPDEVPYTESYLEPEVEGSGEEEEQKRPHKITTENPKPELTDDILASTEETHEFISLTTIKPKEVEESKEAEVSKEDESLVSSGDVEKTTESQQRLPSTTGFYSTKDSEEPIIDKTDDIGSGELPEDSSLKPHEDVSVASVLPDTEEIIVTTETYEHNIVTSGLTESESSELQTPVTSAPFLKEENTHIPADQDAVTNKIGDLPTSIPTIEHDITVTAFPVVEEDSKTPDSTESSKMSEESATKDFETSNLTTLRTPIIEEEVKESTQSADQNIVTSSPGDFISEGNFETQHYPSSTSAPSLDDEFVTTETQELATDGIKETDYFEPQHITASTPMLEEIEKDTTEYTEPDQVIPSGATQDDTFNILSTTLSNVPVIEKNKDKGESTISGEHISEDYVPGTTNIPVFDQQGQSTAGYEYIPETSVDTGVKDNSTPEEYSSSTTTSSLIDKERKTTPDLGTAVSEYEGEPHEYSSSTAVSPVESEEATTEPDKGLNTIPSEGIDEEIPVSSEELKPTMTEEKITTETNLANKFSTETEDMISSTVSDTSVSRKDQPSLTTESTFRKEDYSPTESQISPKSTTVTDGITEEVISTLTLDHTKSTESGPSLQHVTETTLSPKYTEIIEETTVAKEKTKVPNYESSTSETMVSEMITEKPTTSIPLHEKETTTANQEDNEIFNEPRIPGEGDCLLNGVTYTNETTVPSTNKCQSGCKCVSSIIKCDPIICSPPPEYMDNCETTYDTPDACCPTYICDHKTETIPPQSHSQMSGTEAPVISPVHCHGDECEFNKDQKHHDNHSDACKSGSCAGPSDDPNETTGYSHSENIPEKPIIVQTEECVGDQCKQVSCTNENGCQATPIQPCEGEKCETSPDVISSPETQQCAYGENCAVSGVPAIECIGDNCDSSGTQLGDIHPTEICTGKEGCLNVPQNPEDECKEDQCRRKDSSPLDKHDSEPCTGPDCKPTQTDSETSVSPAFEQSSLGVDEDNKKDITETTEKLESVTSTPDHHAYSVETPGLSESHEIVTKQPDMIHDESLTTVSDIIELEIKPEPETATQAVEYSGEQGVTSGDLVTEKNEVLFTESLDYQSSASTQSTKKDSNEDISSSLSDVEVEMTDKSKTQKETIDTERPQEFVTTEKSTSAKTSDVTEPTKVFTSHAQETTEPAEKLKPEDGTSAYVDESNTEPSVLFTIESHDITKPSIDIEDVISTDTVLDSSTEPPKPQDDMKKPDISDYAETTVTLVQESSTKPSEILATESVTEASQETELTKSTSGIKDDVPQSATEPTVIETHKQVGETDHTQTVPEPSEYDATTVSAITDNLHSITVSKSPDTTNLPEETEHKDATTEITEKTVTEPTNSFNTESLEITKFSDSFDQEVTTQKMLERPSTDPSSHYTEKQNEITTSQESKATTAEVDENITVPSKTQTETQLDTKSPTEIERDSITITDTETTQSYATEPTLPENIYHEKTTSNILEESSSEPSKIYDSEDHAIKQSSEKSDHKETTPNIYDESSETSLADSHMIPEEIDQKDKTSEIPVISGTEPVNEYPIEQEDDNKSPIEIDQEITTDNVLDESITEPPKSFDTELEDISKLPVQDTTSKISQVTKTPLFYTTESIDTSKSSEESFVTTVKAITETASDSTKSEDEIKHEIVTLKPITEGPFEKSEMPEIISTQEQSTSKIEELTTPSSLSDSKITTSPKDKLKETTGTATDDFESKLPQTEGVVETESSVKEQESTTPLLTDHSIAITDTPLSSDSDQTHFAESTPILMEQATQKPDIETQTISSVTSVEEISKPDLEATKQPEKAITTQHIDTEIQVPAFIPTEQDDLKTTSSEIYDLTTSKSIEASHLPHNVEVKTEYPELSYTTVLEQNTDNILYVSQESATEDIISTGTEKQVISEINTDKPETAENIDYTKEIESGTESSQISSESKPAVQENYTESISKYSTPEPSAGYDSTKAYPDETTVEPVYHETKEPVKPVDDLIQSLVTEKYEPDTKPSDFEKDSQTETPSQISSVTPEDVKEPPQQDNVRDELSTQSSISADTTLKELDDKIVMSTEYDKPVEQNIQTESPSYVDRKESDTTTQKTHLPEDGTITQEPSAIEQNNVITSLTTEQKSSTERADMPAIDATTEAIAPDTSFTEKQELVPSDKPSVDLYETPTESSYTTDILEKQTELALEITKVPDIQIQTEIPEAVSAESPTMPSGTEIPTPEPISDEHDSTPEDQRTTETSESGKKQSDSTTLEPSIKTEMYSPFEPTIAPQQEYTEGSSSTSEEIGHTDKPKEESTKTSAAGEFTTESAFSERYTEKQPDTLQAVPSDKPNVEEFVTTKKQLEPEIYQTTESGINIINEISTRPSVSPDEGLTTLAQDIEQKPPAEDQSIPVVISETEKTLTTEEYIAVQTERVIPDSEKPIQETTAPEEEFLIATPKGTTSITDEEISTLSPSADRTTKPTDAPAEPYSTRAPDASITVASDVLISAVPEEPVTTAPDAFMTSKPEPPVTKTSKVPVTTEAEASATITSETPVTIEPEEPTTKTSEALVTNASEGPITSASDAPETPITNVPEVLITSATEAPEAPITNAPEAPITSAADVPETPITDAPEAPIITASIATEAPITEAPEAPNTNQPEAPIISASETPETPITNAPEAPITSASEAPEALITSEPKAPSTIAPEAPESSITSEPKAPITTASEAPESPVTYAPETPITSTPEVPEPPISSVTEASITNAPEAAITSAPEADITKASETPSSSAPEAPITSASELPVTAAPELPKPVSTEASPTDEILPPDEEGSFPPSGGTSGYGQEPDYVEEDQTFGPGTCRYGGKVYVSAQQIPRDDPCDFCFCFRSDIICLQQSCPPPIHGCHEEPIQGFCCPRYECPVSMATTVNVTTTTTTTTTTLPPHFPTHSYKGSVQKRGCQIKGQTYKVGEVVRASSGPCLHCTCGGDGQMKCDPKVCTPEPMLRQMIAAAVSAKRRR